MLQQQAGWEGQRCTVIRSDGPTRPTDTALWAVCAKCHESLSDLLSAASTNLSAAFHSSSRPPPSHSCIPKHTKASWTCSAAPGTQKAQHLGQHQGPNLEDAHNRRGTTSKTKACYRGSLAVTPHTHLREVHRCEASVPRSVAGLGTASGLLVPDEAVWCCHCRQSGNRPSAEAGHPRGQRHGAVHAHTASCERATHSCARLHCRLQPDDPSETRRNSTSMQT